MLLFRNSFIIGFSYMEKYLRCENAFNFMEIEDVARQQKAETVYR